jgi:hypothetical protein
MTAEGSVGAPTCLAYKAKLFLVYISGVSLEGRIVLCLEMVNSALKKMSWPPSNQLIRAQ